MTHTNILYLNLSYKSYLLYCSHFFVECTSHLILFYFHSFPSTILYFHFLLSLTVLGIIFFLRALLSSTYLRTVHSRRVDPCVIAFVVRFHAKWISTSKIWGFLPSTFQLSMLASPMTESNTEVKRVRISSHDRELQTQFSRALYVLYA